MHNKLQLKALLALLILFSTTSFAQSDLNIFGFYQVQLQKVNGFFTVKGDVPTPAGKINMTFQKDENDYLTTGIQQANIFFRKDLSSKLTTWINLEFLNSFSTEKNWGELNLEEAWVNYDHNQYLNVKAGVLIPKFNYLNEIKNRMPLLPYVVRPMVYEASLRSIINTADFLPERAFLQLSGKIYKDDFEFNYAAFVGNAESEYTLIGENIGAAVTGTDTTNFKLFGGRVGVQFGDLRLGVSSTFDKDNQQKTIKEDVDRVRLGADFGFTFSNFFMDAEYIKVSLSPSKSLLDMDKLFYYGTLGYDFSDQLFVYASYNYVEDKQIAFLANGMQGVLFGGGFKPINSVVLKFQYATFFVNDGKFPITINPAIPPIQADTKLDFKGYLLALSVLF